jgi:uncharacterized protein (DUF1697 family)
VTTYVALLRAVNVAGHGKVSMADLRRVLEEMGLADVTTYLQSGNAVFTASPRSTAQLRRDIERRVAEQLGVASPVVLRTEAELAEVVESNPFLRGYADPATLYVAFLATEPGVDRVASLQRPAGEDAEFSVTGRHVYLRYPSGYGRTKLTNAYLEKRLGVPATTRNWRTVSSLAALASVIMAPGRSGLVAPGTLPNWKTSSDSRRRCPPSLAPRRPPAASSRHGRGPGTPFGPDVARWVRAH